MDITGTLEVLIKIMKPDDIADLTAISLIGKEERFIELFIKAISRMGCNKYSVDSANIGYIETQLKLKLEHLLTDLKEKEKNP